MCLWLATWDMNLQHAQLRGEGASREARGDGVLGTEAEGALDLGSDFSAGQWVAGLKGLSPGWPHCHLLP